MSTTSAALKEVTSKSTVAGRLETADALAQALLGGHASSKLVTQEDGGFAAEISMIPLRVRSHYTKTLLDWAVGTLCKGWQGNASAQQQPNLQSSPRSNPLCWRLLAALLRVPGVQGWVVPTGPLFAAATAACKDSTQGSLATDGLAKAILDVLHLVDAAIRGGSQPSIDQTVALAVAAIWAANDQPGHEGDEWRELAAYLLVLLRHHCLANPNQRKAYAVIVGDLLVAILQSAFREGASPSHTVGSLEAVGLHLVDSVVFHTSHVQGLAELASNEALRWYKSDLKPDGEDKGVVEARSYHWQLHEVLTEAIATGCADTVTAVMRAGPWLLQRFTAAVTRHRRTAASDAAAALEPKRTTANDASTAREGGIAQSAGFHFFSTLAQPLLALLTEGGSAGHDSASLPNEEDEQVGKQKGKRKRPGAEEPSVQKSAKRHKGAKVDGQGDEAGRGRLWALVAEGMASLVRALKDLGVYQVTEDVDGAHQKLLARIGDAALTASCPGSNGQNSLRNGASALAAAELVGALMDVEHRSLQPHLVQLWDLIWVAAQCEPSVKSQELTAGVAGKMVGAYAELRHLEALLLSLQQALAPGCSHQAAAVITCPTFQASLHAALAELPPGQAPAIVRFVGAGISTLLTSSGMGLDALGALYACCLEGLEVTLPTSSALASSVQALMKDCLAGPLGSLLQELFNARFLSDETLQTLGVLLSIYARLLQVHSKCAALQPQIAPLPGQFTGDLSAQEASDASARRGGFFQAIGSQHSLVLVAEQLLAAIALPAYHAPPRAQGIAGGVETALVECVLQRMGVLDERVTRIHYSCAVITVDTEVADLAPDQEAAEEAADAAEAVKEARDLSSLLLSLVAAADHLQPDSPQLQAAKRWIWLLSSSHAALLLRWGCREAAIPFLHQILHHATHGSGSTPGAAYEELEPGISVLAGSLISNVRADSDYKRHQRLLAQLGSEGAEVFRSAFPAAACASIAQRLQDAFSVDKQAGKQARGVSAHPTTSPGNQLASLLRQGIQQSSQLVENAQQTVSLNGMDQLVAGFAVAQQDGFEAGTHHSSSNASASSKLAEEHGVEWTPSSKALSELSALLALLAKGHFHQLSEASITFLTSQLVLCLMALLSALDLQSNTASLRTSAQVAQHRKQDLGSGLVLAIEATLQALRSVMDMGTDGAVRMLAAAGTATMLLLCNTERHCRKGAFANSDGGIASEHIMELTASLEERLFAYLLGFRSAPDPAAEASDTSADAHAAALQTALELQRNAEAFAGAAANGTHALGSCQLTALRMQAFAAALRQAWGTLDKPSKKGGASILTGPAALSWHEVTPSVLAACTHILEKATARALTLANGAAAASLSLDARLSASCMAALLGAAGHLLDARRTISASQAMEEASPLTGGPAALLSATRTLLSWVSCDAAAKSSNQQMRSADEYHINPVSAASLGRDTVLMIAGDSTRSSSSAVLAEGDSARGAAHQALARRKAPAAAIASVIQFLAAAGRQLQHVQIGGASEDAAFNALVSLHHQMLQAVVPVEEADAPVQASVRSGPAATKNLRPELLSSARQMAEAANLPQLRQLLTSLEEDISCVSTSPEALPLLEVLLEVLECGGSPVKLRMIGQEALTLTSLLLAFLQRHPLQGSSDSPACNSHDQIAASAAAVRVALRCLESIAGRPGMFELAPRMVAACLHIPIVCFAAGAHSLPVSREHARAVAAAFVQACKMLVALLRHHQQHARRCMALLAVSARGLLKLLLAVAPHSAHLAAACAEELAHVYTALAEQQGAIGMYCVHLLADYLVLIAASSGKRPAYTQADSSQAASSELPAEAGALLRQGAFALYGACSAVEVQHVFAALGRGAGGTRKIAIASLRRDYEKHYKYTGKV